jgi:hypothetical protein
MAMIGLSVYPMIVFSPSPTPSEFSRARGENFFFFLNIMVLYDNYDYIWIIMVIYDWQLVGDMIWLFQMANTNTHTHIYIYVYVYIYIYGVYMSLLENMGQMGYNYWDIVYGYY